MYRGGQNPPPLGQVGRVATFLENLEKAWNLKMPLENLENLEFLEKFSQNLEF